VAAEASATAWRRRRHARRRPGSTPPPGPCPRARNRAAGCPRSALGAARAPLLVAPAACRIGYHGESAPFDRSNDPGRHACVQPVAGRSERLMDHMRGGCRQEVRRVVRIGPQPRQRRGFTRRISIVDQVDEELQRRFQDGAGERAGGEARCVDPPFGPIRLRVSLLTAEPDVVRAAASVPTVGYWNRSASVTGLKRPDAASPRPPAVCRHGRRCPRQQSARPVWQLGTRRERRPWDIATSRRRKGRP